LELSPKLQYEASRLMLSEVHLKVIIDLVLKNLSVNAIADHLQSVYKRYKTHKFIKRLVKFYGKHAKRLNGYYDSLVRDKFEVLEVDEIYQGKNCMFIGIVNKYSTYLYGLEQSYSKTTEDIASLLRPYFEKCDNLSVVLTDGLNSYNEGIKQSADGSIHLLCHVHGYRDVMKALDPILRRSRKSYQRLKDAKAKVKLYSENSKKALRNFRIWQKRLDIKTLERDEYYLSNNIKKYSKKVKRTEKMEEFKEELSILRSYVRYYEQSLNLWQKKKAKVLREIEKLEEEYWLHKIDALQSGRLVREFKQLLDCKYNLFNVKFSQFRRKLEKSPYSIAKKLLKLLKRHPKYFSDKSDKIQAIIPPNFANTNTVESVFSRYRLFFNNLRNIKPTKYTKALFELVRLKHNLNGPLTGINKGLSPISRLNIKTKYTNFIDALF